MGFLSVFGLECAEGTFSLSQPFGFLLVLGYFGVKGCLGSFFGRPLMVMEGGREWSAWDSFVSFFGGDQPSQTGNLVVDIIHVRTGKVHLFFCSRYS